MVLPWPQNEQPDPNTVYLIDIDDIGLPDLRVTSTFTPEQTEELRDSILTEGQKDPVKLIWSDNRLVLADGFNRISALRFHQIPKVKALISIGTIKDVQIANIITARTRGKENPAQTAEVIRDLHDNEKMSDKEIMRRLGLSPATYNRLYAISGLPQEVKDYVKHGRLGVGAAALLAQIPDPMKIVLIAQQGTAWAYTEEQYKAAIAQELAPQDEAVTTKYTFDNVGKPRPVYPKCSLCNCELQAYAEVVYLCPEDKILFDQFKAQFLTPQAQE